MSAAKMDLVKSWISKAKSDVDSAKILSETKNPHLDTAIFHCQQAAEKAVKGFLAFHDREVEKTHNVESLIIEAAEINHGFLSLKNYGASLTP